MTRAIVLLFAALLAFGPAWATQASDDKIYDQVRLKLVSDPDVKGGAVTSDRGKQKAEHLTKKVKGVHSVVNELTIKVQ
jgi:osmotically-inducible protein OsmY